MKGINSYYSINAPNKINVPNKINCEICGILMQHYYVQLNISYN